MNASAKHRTENANAFLHRPQRKGTHRAKKPRPASAHKTGKRTQNRPPQLTAPPPLYRVPHRTAHTARALSAGKLRNCPKPPPRTAPQTAPHTANRPLFIYFSFSLYFCFTTRYFCALPMFNNVAPRFLPRNRTPHHTPHRTGFFDRPASCILHSPLFTSAPALPVRLCCTHSANVKEMRFFRGQTQSTLPCSSPIYTLRTP